MFCTANDVLGPSYFNKETFRGIDYYQILDFSIHSEAKQFPQNSVS